jgi:hypothetical protein
MDTHVVLVGASLSSPSVLDRLCKDTGAGFDIFAVMDSMTLTKKDMLSVPLTLGLGDIDKGFEHTNLSFCAYATYGVFKQLSIRSPEHIKVSFTGEDILDFMNGNMDDNPTIVILTLSASGWKRVLLACLNDTVSFALNQMLVKVYNCIERAKLQRLFKGTELTWGKNKMKVLRVK